MITMMFVNFFLDIGSRFIINYFSTWTISLSNVTNYLSVFSVPQTLLDIISLAAYFLPFTNVLILLGMTFIFIQVKLVVALIHFGTLGLIFK